jgi:hypothetical protein
MKVFQSFRRASSHGKKYLQKIKNILFGEVKIIFTFEVFYGYDPHATFFTAGIGGYNLRTS